MSSNPCPTERHNRGKSHGCLISDFLFSDHLLVLSVLNDDILGLFDFLLVFGHLEEFKGTRFLQRV